MHLGHVGAPQHEGVGFLEIVVTAHRLIDAESAHEAANRRGHAVARVGFDVVGAETRLHQLRRGIAFPHRPLAGTEHANARRSVLLQCCLELLRHDVEGLIPTDGGEITILGVLAVLHA